MSEVDVLGQTRTEVAATDERGGQAFMYSQFSRAATASTVANPKFSAAIEPLDRESFEHLDEAEAVSLLAGRFRCFIERGWGCTDALLLAVRPDRALPHSGDAAWR
jgi:hypothetical protein